MFLNFLRPLMTAGLPLKKSVLVPLGLTTTASATDADIQTKIFVSGTTLVFSYDKWYLIFHMVEIDDIIKIVKSLEYVGLLINGVSKTVENEVKEEDFFKKEDF